jgi:hypothetical protein
MKKRKVIAVGDYIRRQDRIISITTTDSENPTEEVDLFFRIKTPSPRESIKMMEFVNNRVEGKTIGSDDFSFENLSPDERNKYIKTSLEYEALLVSSCVFLPPDDLSDLSQKTNRVWETLDDVLDYCPLDLFNKLKNEVSGEKLFINTAEAKK